MSTMISQRDVASSAHITQGPVTLPIPSLNWTGQNLDFYVPFVQDSTMNTSSRLHIQSSRQNSRTPLATKRKANSMVKRAVKQYCITWICIGRISMEPMLICTSTPMKTAFSSTTVAKNQSKRGWPTSHCQQFSGLFMCSRLVPLQLAKRFLELIPCAWSALSRSFKSACENLRTGARLVLRQSHERKPQNQRYIGAESWCQNCAEIRGEQLGCEGASRGKRKPGAAFRELHTRTFVESLSDVTGETDAFPMDCNSLRPRWT